MADAAMTVPAPRPAPGESLTAWAKRCAEQERLASRGEWGPRLLALISSVLTWPADRVTVVHGPAPKHETYAWVDDIRFWLVTDEFGDYLLAAGQDGWHEVRTAAELGELMRSGKLQGFGI